MKIEFFNRLKTTPVNTRYDKLVEDWRVGVARMASLVIVPKGFKFDWDSVPRIPWVYWRFKNRMKHAAALHDWLYFAGRAGIEKVTRKEADLIMLDCMVKEGVPAYYRFIIYRGVRIGGWRGWNRYRAMNPTEKEKRLL